MCFFSVRNSLPTFSSFKLCVSFEKDGICSGRGRGPSRHLRGGSQWGRVATPGDLADLFLSVNAQGVVLVAATNKVCHLPVGIDLGSVAILHEAVACRVGQYLQHIFPVWAYFVAKQYQSAIITT